MTSDTIDNYIITTFSVVNNPTNGTDTSSKLKRIPRRSCPYPFEFLRVSFPKPAAENGISKKSLDMSLKVHFVATTVTSSNWISNL